MMLHKQREKNRKEVLFMENEKIILTEEQELEFTNGKGEEDE